MTSEKISRRGAIGGLAAAGVGVPLLAACSSNDPTTASDPAGTPAAGSTGSTAPTGSAGSTGSAGGGEALAKVSAIDVGGGEIFADQKVVVTQPTAGDFKCFTAVCTHQGCLVSSVSDGTINCDCHGSQYSIKDGSVVSGPAPSPLEAEPITVAAGEITLQA